MGLSARLCLVLCAFYLRFARRGVLDQCAAYASGLRCVRSHRSKDIRCSGRLFGSGRVCLGARSNVGRRRTERRSSPLLLCMLFILGLVRRQPILAGAAVGLLFFKPTDAVVFVLLLVIRREWRALAVVAAACVAWYIASVPASAGDWIWPYHYAAYLSAYYPHQQIAQFLINISAVGETGSFLQRRILAVSGSTPALHVSLVQYRATSIGVGSRLIVRRAGGSCDQSSREPTRSRAFSSLQSFTS